MKKEYGILGLLGALCVITTYFNPRFISANNLSNLATSIGMFGVFSMGLGMVIITGGIDLSVGSMCALVGVLLTMGLGTWHYSWPCVVALVLILPMLVGYLHGWLITRLNLQPFIVTLCGLLLYRGAARYIARDATHGFSEAEGIETLRFLSSGHLGNWVPMPFVILLIVTAILWVVLHRSIYGRYLFAVGRNEQAARYSGINTRLVIAMAYVIAGLLTGISGIMIAFYATSVSPSNHGNFYELYGIAAAVLGGCSLRGGEGSVCGIFIGTALLQVLQNLVNLLKIDSSLNYAVMGAVVLAGVIADQLLQRRTEKRAVNRYSAKG